MNRYLKNRLISADIIGRPILSDIPSYNVIIVVCTNLSSCVYSANCTVHNYLIGISSLGYFLVLRAPLWDVADEFHRDSLLNNQSPY